MADRLGYDPDGSTIVKSGGKLHAFGGTPAIQQVTASFTTTLAATTTTTATTTALQADIDAIRTRLNKLINAMNTLGFTAAS